MSTALIEPKTAKHSIRRTFVVVIALTYIVVAIGAFFAFYLGARAISDRYAARFAVSQNQLEMNRILSLVDRELALSLKLADDPVIRAWMLDESNDESTDQRADQSKPDLHRLAERQLDSYRRFLRDQAYFVAIRESGHYYARTPDTGEQLRTVLDPANPTDRWFYRTVDLDQDYSLNVDHNSFLQENRVWINVLVRDESGRAIGVAGCGMDLTGFLEAIVGHGENGVSTIMIDSEGALIAHPDRSLIEHNAQVLHDQDKIDIYDLISTEADRERLRQRLAVSPDALQSEPVFWLTVGGHRLMATLGTMPELGWFNLVLLDVTSIIGLTDFLPIGLAAIASLLAVLVAVLISMNGLVLRPLSELTRAAGIVANGAYDVSLPVRKADEIGRLSASFNAMTQKIREYTSGLEAMVAKRTEELSEANEKLRQSQQDVLDSIQYGRLIQDAILPSSDELERLVAEHFIIHRPRDLVGGDFTFFRELPDGFCFAVVDCTGHGVPGAFMTMMVNALLNRVMETAPDVGPAAMLTELHTLARDTLRSDNAAAHFDNGFDMALCRFRYSSRVMEFAGGGLPLYVVRGKQVTEIPGDRASLGYASTPYGRQWNEIRIVDAETASFYLVTDGVLDLPGGMSGYGFGRKRLVELLKAAATLPMRNQKEYVEKKLAEYNASYSQRDDVTFAGFRITDIDKVNGKRE